MTSVVINERYGGFGVSEAAFDRLKELGFEGNKPYDANDLRRDDERLVRVVEELGSDASGRYATLVVVQVPDDAKWYIHEYDGYESVHEVHRSWTSDGEETLA